ncbi:MAG: hypothetical protein HWE09_11390 [Cyclobacteriaceae bacterium]|nr:hypothetical protein [Cyclobacteriaceae bacterium]
MVLVLLDMQVEKTLLHLSHIASPVYGPAYLFLVENQAENLEDYEISFPP